MAGVNKGYRYTLRTSAGGERRVLVKDVTRDQVYFVSMRCGKEGRGLMNLPIGRFLDAVIGVCAPHV